MKGKLWLFLFVIKTIVFDLPAQSIQITSPYNVKQWTTLNGLSQNSIRELAYTEDGTIWMASFGGLVNFNGTSFTHYNIGNTPQLGSNRITGIKKDLKGTLWIMHENFGMTLYADGEFTPFAEGTAYEDLNYNSLVNIDDNAYWLSTSEGIKQWDNDSLKNPSFVSPYGAYMSIHPLSKGLFVLSSGVPGYSKQQGIIIVDGENVVKKFAITSDKPWRIRNQSDALWIIAHDRLVRMEHTSPFNTDTLLLPPHLRKPTDLLIDGENMWLGTRNGLFKLTIRENNIQHETNILENTSINCLMTGKNNSIWVGSEGKGLFLISPRHVLVWETNTPTAKPVVSATIDGKGGVWHTTFCDDLVHYNGREIDQIYKPSSCIQMLYYNPFNEEILAGSSHLVLRIREQKMDTIVALPNNSFEGRVTCLFVDSKKTLWIGAGTGDLYKFSQNTLTAVPIKSGHLLNTIKEVAPGELWIGTTDGIAILKNEQLSFITEADGLAPGSIRSIHQDTDGIIWAGSYGGGLSRIDGKQITVINTNAGLSENIVSRIHEDKHQRLWMLGNLGLFQTSIDQLNAYASGKIDQINCILLDATDGMREGNGSGQVAKSADGLTWWPTIDGIATIHADKFRTDSTNIHIEIQSVKSKNEPIEIIDNRIRLTEWDRDFEISFTGVHYQTPERVKYQHQLEGYDNNWIQDGNNHTLSYTNLAPGEYTLKIQAANPHNIWSNDILKINLSIVPHLWERSWVKALGVLVIVCLAILLIRWRTYALLRGKRILEQKVKMRTHQLEYKNKQLKLGHLQLEQTIEELKQTQDQLVQSEKMASLGILAAGVAHEINNPLNYIRGGLYSIFNYLQERNIEFDDDLTLYRNTINEGIERTTHIVKSLNQFSRSGQSMDETCHINEILDSCLVMVNNELKDRIEVVKNYSTLTPINGNVGNLFQVFLNLIVNACQSIRDEGTVTIETRMFENNVCVSISDTGIGISEENISKIMDPFFTTKEPGEGTGLGLSISYELIQNHHGSIAVESEVNEGSTFTIYLPAQMDKNTNSDYVSA